jgi:bifunctional non-homologous end joining protein LigD
MTAARLVPPPHAAHARHIEADGPTVFAHACKMGLEGIVSKRRNSPYRSGRSPDWLKMKNSACEAVRREEEEDCGR